MSESTRPDVAARPSAAAARPSARAWVGLAVLALPMLLLSMDMSVLFLALPALATDLGASSIQQLWITDIYGFMIAGFLVTMGTLGDRIGRRRLLLTGAAGFAAASALAAFSTSPEMLIVARLLLGITGSTIAPTTLALASELFTDPARRATAISVVFASFMVGTALGPLLGGLMLQHFWWGSVFLLGIPVMALLLIAGPAVLPARPGSGTGSIDVPSILSWLVASLSIVYGLKELAKHGFTAVAVVTIVGGVAVGIAFVRRQRRLEDPLLDLSLFTHRAFSTVLAINVPSAMVMGGLFLFITQYLQLVAGLDPLRAGLWLVPSSLAMLAGILSGPSLARRIHPGSLIAVGLLVAAIGFGVLTQVGSDGDLPTLVVGITVAQLGIGLPAGLGVTMIMSAAPDDKAGSASAISETSQELGISLGYATIGSLGVALYGMFLDTSTLTGLTPTDAEAAREGLAGALAASGSLPAAATADLVTSGREAFTIGLTVAAAIATALFVLLAAVAARVLRPVDVPGAQAGGPDPSGARSEHPDVADPPTDRAASETVTPSVPEPSGRRA